MRLLTLCFVTSTSLRKGHPSSSHRFVQAYQQITASALSEVSVCCSHAARMSNQSCCAHEQSPPLVLVACLTKVHKQAHTQRSGGPCQPDVCHLRNHSVLQIYTTFYCRINEPSYIKHLKLDILAAIADETNAYDIATELTEYVNDIDEKLARKAIRTVGKIALEVTQYPHPNLPGVFSQQLSCAPSRQRCLCSTPVLLRLDC